MKTMTVKEWNAEGERLFGDKWSKWRFVCVRCKTVQSGEDFRDLGMEPEEIEKYLGFSCVGRFTPNKGCDWTLGGLLLMHTLEIIDEEGVKHPRFEFDMSGAE